MTITLKFLEAILLLSLCLTSQAQEYENSEKVKAELEIANLELQDDCENVAQVVKSSLISNTFDDKLKVRETHAELLKLLSENLRQLENDVPQELLKNWTLLVTPGDELLREKDWSTLVSFDVNNDQLMHTSTVHCKNNSRDCQFIKRGYEDILESSKNLTLLKKGWAAWQTLVSWRRQQFPNVLNLVTLAAQQNGKDHAKAYWEMMVDKEDSYEFAEMMWEQIKPLYFKLHAFVKKRLFKFHNITEEETEIPVYLLGSHFGNDWSSIAGIVLPHLQIYHDAEVFLNKTKIKDIYVLAEQMTKNLSLGPLGAKFWTNSRFNMSFCENHLVSFCVGEHSELFACDKVSWGSYLDAFEVSMDVALRGVDYLNLARSNLRYSVIDEAIKGMGSVLAMQNLHDVGIWGHFSEGDSNEMTQLLLIALRALPRLPFYLAADKWRLHLLEHGFDKYEESWWERRKEYQGVKGILGNETDFLGDSYFTSNKPYLSKFLGTILQFQFLEYYKNPSANDSIVDSIRQDNNFLGMLHERSSTDWPSSIVNYYSIYDLSASSLLDFFAPLENYLDTAPLDQVPVTTTVKPKTTKGPVKIKVEAKELLPAETSTDVNEVKEDTEPPLPPKHEHVEENLDGPNHPMEHISMYIGLALLGAVIAIIISVIVSKRMKKKKRSNNRRFET